VSRSHPFWSDIQWLEVAELTSGYEDGTFRPAATVTRQALSAFLFRLADVESSYVPPVTPSFDDVSPGHPFFTEIEWMAEEEISTGYGDGTFRPGAALTRGAMAAFIFRFGGGPFTLPATPTFTDVSFDHPFSEAVEWMFAAGLTTGYTDGTFRPGAAISRAAMAAFLHRYYINRTG
jgi:hypothetical protein